MAKRSTNVVPLAAVKPVQFGEALSERYLSYALSTIMARSLPDVRDGLKPVHRRLLYAMRQLRLDPNSAFKKSARVVGDVIGKYHPHGDQSIYDALVRLAQDFAARYPLVDGQGNFGNIDGDNPAAMRYTEARLTEVAEALLDGIDEDAVDFRPNYDGSTEEPVVLPGGFPNLLANGAAGIAVGMATSIPPHNAGELCDALLHLIKTPNARIDTLVDLVQGPGLPDRRRARRAARGDRRGLQDRPRRLPPARASWEKEELPRGQYQIVVTEIPYQVQKGKLIERIAELINDKKLPLLEDVRDESADDVRLVLEPQHRPGAGRAADGAAVPADRPGDPLSAQPQRARQGQHAARHGPARGAAGLPRPPPRGAGAALDLPAGRDRAPAGDPRRLPDRLSQPRQGDPDHPRGGRAQAQADQGLQAHRPAGRGDPQHAPARAAPAGRVRDQGRAQEALGRAQGPARRCSKDEELQWGKIADEIQETKRKFGGKTALGRRRTELADAPADGRACRSRISSSASRSPSSARTRAGSAPPRAISTTRPRPSSSTRKATAARFAVHAQTTDKLLVFATNGRFYTLGCDKLPSARGHGEPIRLMIDLGNEQDIVAARGAQGRAQVPGRLGRRPRLHRAGGRGRGADQERQAGAEPRRQGEGAGLRRRARRRRFDRRPQRKPQAPDLPDRAGAGDGPRPRRDRCRSPRPIGCPTRRPSGSRTACRGPTASSRPAS